jgi:divalent metal cation (Fe/Co/Zn/Cd) transporter
MESRNRGDPVEVTASVDRTDIPPPRGRFGVRPATGETQLLVRYMYASIAAAVATIALKALAAALTGSVGFPSDALESGVNLVAAIVALLALLLAVRPRDTLHDFGHGKAE